MGLIKTAVVSTVVVALGINYWVLPAIDKITPWDGALPAGCGAAPEPRPAGLTGLANDAGLKLRALAEGPPTAADMVAWAGRLGESTAAVNYALDEGSAGRQLLPLAPLPAAPGPLAVSAPEDVAARALLAAGATPAEAVTLTAHAGAESGFDPLAKNPGSSATGLWQIMDVHGLSTAERQNPQLAAQKALSLAREPNGVQRHWAQTVEASKAYEARAAAAVARAGGTVTAVCSVPPAPQGTWVNGAMPSEALVAMPGGQRLRVDAAAAFTNLSAAYAQVFGQPLAVGSGYRSYAEQAAVKRAKPGLAAEAGRSQHGLGLAADLQGPGARFGTREHAWLNQNAPAFGWHHPDWAKAGGKRPEPWHWEFREQQAGLQAG
jgi:LAS superfamily LD-carboxypeptidase LdcB